MEETIVALDAMGGDNAPGEIVKGAVDALKKSEAVKILLYGDKESVVSELSKHDYPEDRLTFFPTTEIIETAEHPVDAIRHKKDSSMVRAMMAVKEGQADAIVSAGNSGALLAGGQLKIGRIKGVKRSPFAPVIPTEKGPALIIDSGANLDAKSDWLVQYAIMGSIYMRDVINVTSPRVAILNVGAEEEKGNALVKETFPLLKETEGINFIGSIEARDIAAGYADVIVCDAFTGNAVLKMYEGVGTVMLRLIKKSFMKNAITKLGAMLSIKSLKKELKKFDVTQYGGAPMLGLNGLVVKTHGSAKSKEICTAILQCIDFKNMHIKEKITDNLGIVENN